MGFLDVFAKVLNTKIALFKLILYYRNISPLASVKEFVNTLIFSLLPLPLPIVKLFILASSGQNFVNPSSN